ncbi:MAG: hypothetical protein AB1894_10150 [Chloroflexota bacterium]
MQSEPITILVDPEAARAFRSASPEYRRKLELLLGRQLLDFAHSQPSLEQVMHEISQNAKERGLTPDILEQLPGD